jgi:multidrug resistance efflux pump
MHDNRIVTPLDDTDIQWTPFVDDEVAIHSRDTDDEILLVLDDDEVRAYCRELRADMRTVSEALRASVAMLAQVTTQRDRLREQTRQLREWNNDLAVAVGILQREAA